MISKKKQIKRMFGLLQGIDYKSDDELDKYICAVDGYLEALEVPVPSSTMYSDEAEEELDNVIVEVFPSAQLAYASRTGPVLSEDDAREELLSDERIGYIHDEKGFFVVFCND